MKTAVYFPPYQYDSAANEIVSVKDPTPLLGGRMWYGRRGCINCDVQDRCLLWGEETVANLPEDIHDRNSVTAPQAEVAAIGDVAPELVQGKVGFRLPAAAKRILSAARRE